MDLWHHSERDEYYIRTGKTKVNGEKTWFEVRRVIPGERDITMGDFRWATPKMVAELIQAGHSDLPVYYP